jgi:quercetin dioxygenase-like cupin family protein
MSLLTALRRLSVVAVVTGSFVWLGAMKADVDPKVASVLNLNDIKWVENPNGSNATYIISGEPNKEGSMYVELMKWHPHHNSMPHTHPHDRFITVLSGTWWVGTGPHYDMSTTTPMRAGSIVTHFAKQIHYDGARDEDAVIEIVGMGTAETTPAGDALKK